VAHLIKRSTATGMRYDVRTRIAGRVVTKTFTRRRDADAYAATTEADKLRGVVVDPRRSKITVRAYADSWLSGRSDLAVRTAELYRWLLDRHILPKFGSQRIGAVSMNSVRSWHVGIASAHPTTAAKAYRLLRTIMNSALADDLIIRNPCRVRAAGQEKAIERPVATVAEVQALADAMPDHLRIAVLLATWCQLRRAELLGLRRQDFDILRGTVSIRITRTKMMDGQIVEKAPKSYAGLRTIVIPDNVVAPLTDHLNLFVGAHADSPVLVGMNGRAVIPGVLHAAWNKARLSVGRSDLRFHDLRHTGLTWSAATGATTKELMHRAGHSSPAAALRYQHATADRDRVLATALAAMAPLADVVSLGPRDMRAMKGPTRKAEGRGHRS
jgi:integrase